MRYLRNQTINYRPKFSKKSIAPGHQVRPPPVQCLCLPQDFSLPPCPTRRIYQEVYYGKTIAGFAAELEQVRKFGDPQAIDYLQAHFDQIAGPAGWLSRCCRNGAAR